MGATCIGHCSCCRIHFEFLPFDDEGSLLNISTRELINVKMWEQGLTHVKTRLPSRMNELVDRCEIAILSRCENLAFSNLTNNS